MAVARLGARIERAKGGGRDEESYSLHYIAVESTEEGN
jgi:hypothetical protein